MTLDLLQIQMMGIRAYDKEKITINGIEVIISSSKFMHSSKTIEFLYNPLPNFN